MPRTVKSRRQRELAFWIMWLGPALAAILACSTGGQKAAPGIAANGGAGQAGHDAGIVIPADGSGGISIVPDGGGGTSTTPVVPPWTPPQADDNCGERCYFAPELPQSASATPADLFAGTGAASAPTIVYPLAGSVHPINMLSVTFQWQRQVREHEYTWIQVQGVSSWDFYVACKHVRKFVQDAHLDECVYELPRGSWGALAYENRDQSVSVTLVTSDGAGDTSAASAPLDIVFSEDAVQGALYFWSIADLAGDYDSGIWRAPFGAEQASPFISPETAENPEKCGGCHSISRDGEVIAFAAGEHSNSGRLTVAPTASPAQHYVAGGTSPSAVVMTLNPDGSRLIAARGDGVLDLWDTKAGTKLSQVDAEFLDGLGATHPEWSPDGSQIAVTLAPHDAFAQEDDGSWDTWSVKQGGIGLLPYNDGAFGPVQTVVPIGDSEINGFPTFSPDGKWLAFVSGAPGGPYNDNTQNPNNRLRLVNIESGELYELAQATQASAAHAMPGGRATWPKFAPFTQADDSLMFLTFHSRLEYGYFTATGAFGGNDEIPWSPVQLWFAAVDLRNLSSGDPSAPPIYLTLQDPTRENHLGYWSEKIGCDDSETNLCGDYSTCEGNICVPKPVVPK